MNRALRRLLKLAEAAEGWQLGEVRTHLAQSAKSLRAARQDGEASDGYKAIARVFQSRNRRMSSIDSKPPSVTRFRSNWYFYGDDAARRVSRLVREMSVRHVSASSACVAAIVVTGLCITAVSRASGTAPHVILWTDDGTISPDAMQRARGVKNLPTMKIVDMTFVFTSR